MWEWVRKLTPGSTDVSGAQPVVFGLDFGTSCTKLVIQIPLLPGAPTFPVDFGSLGHRTAPHLLPSRLYVDRRGGCSLTPTNPAERFAHLKVNLLRPPHGDGTMAAGADHEARAAAHLGLALRYARAYFEQKRPGFSRKHKPDWELNLGIPSAGFDDAWVRERFARVGRAAWVLSGGTSDITFAGASDALAVGTHSLGDLLTMNVIPELAAEVTSYAKSGQRPDGLHVILDMGASTLDICALNLYQANDITSMLTAQVERHGMLFLHRARMKMAEGAPPFHEDPQELLDAIPEPPDELRARFASCDLAYVAAGQGMLLRTIVDLKRVRDPLAEAWRTGLPVFLTGGGTASPLVQRMVAGAKEYGDRHFEWGGLRARRLPCPEGFPNDVFPRLAVAHGLSYRAIDMGTIEPPGAVENVEAPQPSQWRERFIGPEQV